MSLEHILDLDLTLPGGLRNVIRRAAGERLYGARRLLAAGCDEAAPIDEEQVGDVVRAMKPVHHGRLRIVSHAAGAHQVA